MQRYLDGDFQSYWEIRRCGKSVGFAKIDCPACGYQPQLQHNLGESFIWYSYRKYKAVLTHIVDAHLKQSALRHRRIEAEEKRLKATKSKH